LFDGKSLPLGKSHPGENGKTLQISAKVRTVTGIGQKIHHFCQLLILTLGVWQEILGCFPAPNPLAVA